jgi:hypothetical protein
MSLSVLEFPTPSLADIPGKLRDLADAIEEGHFGEIAEAVLVLNGDRLEVFGFGAEADGAVSHYLLCCGARKIENAALEEL